MCSICASHLCHFQTRDLEVFPAGGKGFREVETHRALLIGRMPRSPHLPKFPIGIELLCRSTLLSLLMVTVWESTNMFFDAFISKVSKTSE